MPWTEARLAVVSSSALACSDAPAATACEELAICAAAALTCATTSATR